MFGRRMVGVCRWITEIARPAALLVRKQHDCAKGADNDENAENEKRRSDAHGNTLPVAKPGLSGVDATSHNRAVVTC
jgi:hypothetical protein